MTQIHKLYLPRSIMLSQKKLRKSLGMEENPTCARCPLAKRCEVKDSSHLQLLAKKKV